MSPAIELAAGLATRPGFDCLHDGNPATALIDPYWDPVGYPTQGYGRLLSKIKWEPLDRYPAITREQAWDDLLEDIGVAARSVARLCPVALTDHQRAALIDFAFNCGAGQLQSSTLRQCVLRGDHAGAAGQFDRWVFAGGRKLAGLVRRRQAERIMYETPD